MTTPERFRGCLLGLVAGDALGTTVRDALQRFRNSGDPWSGSTDPFSAGNGCIVRLGPVPMFFFGNVEEAVHHSGESSRTTHGARVGDSLD